jgi:hypothetical protein
MMRGEKVIIKKTGQAGRIYRVTSGGRLWVTLSDWPATSEAKTWRPVGQGRIAFRFYAHELAPHRNG